jgi:hypothetical protein
MAVVGRCRCRAAPRGKEARPCATLCVVATLTGAWHGCARARSSTSSMEGGRGWIPLLAEARRGWRARVSPRRERPSLGVCSPRVCPAEGLAVKQPGRQCRRVPCCRSEVPWLLGHALSPAGPKKPSSSLMLPRSRLVATPFVDAVPTSGSCSIAIRKTAAWWPPTAFAPQGERPHPLPVAARWRSANLGWSLSQDTDSLTPADQPDRSFPSSTATRQTTNRPHRACSTSNGSASTGTMSAPLASCLHRLSGCEAGHTTLAKG